MQYWFLFLWMLNKDLLYLLHIIEDTCCCKNAFSCIVHCCHQLFISHCFFNFIFKSWFNINCFYSVYFNFLFNLFMGLPCLVWHSCSQHNKRLQLLLDDLLFLLYLYFIKIIVTTRPNTGANTKKNKWWCVYLVPDPQWWGMRMGKGNAIKLSSCIFNSIVQQWNCQTHAQKSNRWARCYFQSLTIPLFVNPVPYRFTSLTTSLPCLQMTIMNSRFSWPDVFWSLVTDWKLHREYTTVSL